MGLVERGVVHPHGVFAIRWDFDFVVHPIAYVVDASHALPEAADAVAVEKALAEWVSQMHVRVPRPNLALAVGEQLTEVPAASPGIGQVGDVDAVLVRPPAGDQAAPAQHGLLARVSRVRDWPALGAGIVRCQRDGPVDEVRAAADLNRDRFIEPPGAFQFADRVPCASDGREGAVGLACVGCGEPAGPSVIAVGGNVQDDRLRLSSSGRTMREGDREHNGEYAASHSSSSRFSCDRHSTTGRCVARAQLLLRVKNVELLLSEERHHLRRDILVCQNPQGTEGHRAGSSSTNISFLHERAACRRHA